MSFARWAAPVAVLCAVPASPAVQAAEEAANTNMDEIVVLGTRAAGDTGIPTATDRATESMSQSSLSIRRDLLDAYGTQRLADALQLVSGVSQQNNFGGLRDNFAIRGFLGTPDTGAEFYVDGFLANRGFGSPRDPATVERIEILKGPAGALFGEIDPSGRVNIVSKKPRFETGLSVAASAGSFDTYRIEADATGALSDTIAVRLVGAAENSDGFRDHVDMRRRIIAPSIAWSPADGTEMVYSLEYLVFRSPFDRGIPAVNGDPEAVDRGNFYGEPSDGRTRSRNVRHQLTGQHALNDRWELVGGIAYRDGSISGFSSDPARLGAGGDTMWRQRRLRNYDVSDWSGRIELRGEVDGLAGTHHPAFGVKYYDMDFAEEQLRFSPSAANPYPINILNPQYGGTAGPLRPFTDQREQRRNVTVYVQDLWDVTDRLTLSGGVRFDHLHQRTDNRRTGQITDAKRKPVDFRIGGKYRLTDSLALHASYGESFRANSSTGRDGAAFAPERGEGYEVGVKGVWPGVRAAATWFDIRKTNILATDPVDPNYLAAVGEMRSRGVELDGSADIGRHWQVVANYAWIDAQATDPAFPKNDVLNVPEHSGTLFVLGHFPDVAGGDLQVGAGVNYSSSRAATLNGDGLRLPAYAKVKLSADYAVSENLSIRAEVDNLLDEYYAESSYSALWIMPASPRKAMLTVRYTL